MASFIPTELFGGAMSCEMPQGYIDSSNIRQIPDHQEIYLSPTTLTNVIIEINERSDKDDNGSPHADDIAAAKYHIQDICSDEDTFDETKFDPQPANLGKIQATSAYYGQVRLFPAQAPASIAEAGASVGGAVASSSSREGVELEKKTTVCYYLLVRLEEKTTDILVLVNVPQSELVGENSALEREKVLGSDILEKMIQTLDIKDMSLFG